MRITFSDILFIACLIFCIYVIKSSYTEETVSKYEDMKRPVVLHYKEKATFVYSVVLLDGSGEIHKFGNVSSFANWIGDTYQIGDTISNTIDGKHLSEFKGQ